MVQNNYTHKCANGTIHIYMLMKFRFEHLLMQLNKEWLTSPLCAKYKNSCDTITQVSAISLKKAG